MVIGQIAEAADFLIAGGGPGGYVAALRAAQLGRKVTLVDRDGINGVGGVCLQAGCIPSKTLIEASKLAYRSAHDAAVYGLKTKYSGIDMVSFQNWKDGVVSGLTSGIRGLLSNAGVDIVTGNLSLTKPNEAVVLAPDGQTKFLKFRDLVLATGSRSNCLPGFEINGIEVLDSSGALNLKELPKTIAIIGGGYIGLEIGIALAKLGSKVTIVETGKRLLASMDVGIALFMENHLKRFGITLYLNTEASSFTGKDLKVETPNGEKKIAAEKIIVAVGRMPNSDQLGLDLGMISTDRFGLIHTQKDCRITEHVAAIGDLTKGPALAHKASAEGIIAAEALCGLKVSFQPAAIPSVVFSDPEIASAGLTEKGAQTRGIQVRVSKFPVSSSGRARTLGLKSGFLQIISDIEDDIILGIHIVSPHASDLISEGVLAIEMGATLEDLALSIHPHPTLSELYPEAAYLGLGKVIHTSKTEKEEIFKS